MPETTTREPDARDRCGCSSCMESIREERERMAQTQNPDVLESVLRDGTVVLNDLSPVAEESSQEESSQEEPEPEYWCENCSEEIWDSYDAHFYDEGYSSVVLCYSCAQEREEEDSTGGLSAYNARPDLGWRVAVPESVVASNYDAPSAGAGWTFARPRDHVHVGSANRAVSTAFGLELEWEVGRDFSSLPEIVSAFRRAIDDEGLRDVSVLKSDGSLENGGELVLPPAPLDWWQTVGFEKLDRVLSAGYDAGARSDGWSTTGMHVHVSRCWVSELHAARALLCLTRGKEFWERVAGRKSAYYSDWAHLFWTARQSLWDTYTQTNREVGGLRKKVADALTGTDMSRYSAVTFWTPHGTSEFRFLNGTVHAERAVRRMEAIAALIDWSRDVARRDTFAAGLSGTESLTQYVLRSDSYPLFAAWLRGMRSNPNTPTTDED